MRQKRIIPCLDMAEGRVVKGINFINLRDAGDPVECAKAYEKQGADELVFLDIAATQEKRKTMIELMRRVAKAITIPLTVGGGISELEDMEALLEAGAAKISVNSAGIRNPQLLSDGVKQFGAGRVVCAIDAKETEQGWEVYTSGGQVATGKDVVAWAKEAEQLGAGEILLTSMERDGKKNGYDLEMTRAVADEVAIPVIASGGAGSLQDFYDGIIEGHADAVLAASLFHFNEVSIPELKQYFKKKGIPVF